MESQKHRNHNTNATGGPANRMIVRQQVVIPADIEMELRRARAPVAQQPQLATLAAVEASNGRNTLPPTTEMQSNNSIVEGPQGLTPLTESLSDYQIVSFPGRKNRVLSLLELPNGEVFLPVEHLEGSDARGVLVCHKWLRIGLLSDAERKAYQTNEDPAVRDRFTYNGCHDHRQDQLICFYHADRVCNFENCARLHIDFSVGVSESAVINLYNSMEEIPRARSLVMRMSRPVRAPAAMRFPALAVALAEAPAAPAVALAEALAVALAPAAPIAPAVAAAAAVPAPAVAAAAPAAPAVLAVRFPTYSVSVFDYDYSFEHNTETDMIRIFTGSFEAGVWVCRKWIEYMLTSQSKRGDKLTCHEHSGTQYKPLCGFQDSCRNKSTCRWQHFLESCLVQTAQAVQIDTAVEDIADTNFPVLGTALTQREVPQGYSAAAAAAHVRAGEAAVAALTAALTARPAAPPARMSEVLHSRTNRKTTMCRLVMAGENCERGSSCAFAHSPNDLQPHSSGAYREEFFVKLTTNALPEDFFVNVWDEVLHILTEPKNLQCLNYLNDSHQSINLDQAVLKLLNSGELNNTDYEAMLIFWSKTSKFMRSEERVEKQITFANDFALFGEAGCEREMQVQALCDLIRLCPADYKHNLGNPFEDIAARIADIPCLDETRSRMSQFLGCRTSTFCTYHKLTCPNGGHCTTRIDLRGVTGEKASYKEALDITRLKEAMAKLSAEYEQLLCEGITLFDAKYKDTDSDGFSLVRLRNLRDARIKEITSVKEARALGKRSLPIVGQELKRTYAELMRLTKRTGVCPVTDYMYKPLSVLEVAPVIVVETPLAPLAAGASMPPMIPKRKKVKKLQTEEGYDSEDDDLDYGDAEKGNNRSFPQGPSRPWRPQPQMTLAAAERKAARESKPESELDLEEPSEPSEPRVKRSNGATEAAEDDQTFEEAPRMAFDDSIVFGLSKKERAKLEKQLKREAREQATTPIADNTNAETPSRPKSNKAAAPAVLTDEERLKRIDAEIAAGKEKLRTLWTAQESDAESESELDEDITFAASARVTPKFGSRFYNDDDSDSASEADDDESSDESSSDDCSSIYSDDDELTRTDKHVKQLRRKRRVLLASMQVPTLRALTEDEQNIVKRSALKLLQKDFVPLSEGSKYVVRAVVVDNNGKYKGTGETIPIVFGPFKHENVALELKKIFKGMYVTSDKLSKLLSCKKSDAVQLAPGEDEYYIKFGAKRPKKTHIRVDIASKCLQALVSSNLVPIDLLCKQVSVFLPGNKEDNEEIVKLTEMMSYVTAQSKPVEAPVQVVVQEVVEVKTTVVDGKELMQKLKRYDTQYKLNNLQIESFEGKIQMSPLKEQKIHYDKLMSFMEKMVEDLLQMLALVSEQEKPKYYDQFVFLRYKRIYWETRIPGSA